MATTQQIRSLRQAHLSAGWLHLAQAATLTGLVAQQHDPVRWPLDLRGWATTLQSYPYNLGILVPTFSALSSVNHLVSAGTSYLEWSVEHQQNPLRWGEYSLSAGLMLVMVGTLSGLTDMASLSSLALSNVALQFLGYLVEVRKSEQAAFSELRQLMIVGWLVFLSQWTPILISFFAVAATNDPRPPDMVWGVVLVMWGLFALFGLIQIAYIADWRWVSGGYVQYEKQFIYLSLITKSLLNWMVWGGILAGRKRFSPATSPG